MARKQYNPKFNIVKLTLIDLIDQSPILKPSLATARLPIKHTPDLVVCVVSAW